MNDYDYEVEDRVANLIAFTIKVMRANGWPIERIYEELRIEDLSEITEATNEKLKIIEHYYKNAFALSGRYCPL